MINILVFTLIALVVIATALGMLLNRRAVFSVLFLVLNFASVAFLYLLLGAPFIAFCPDHGLRRRYHGALPVRYHAFGNREDVLLSSRSRGQRWIALILAAAFLVLIAVLVLGQLMGLPELHKPAETFGDPTDIGILLFANYELPLLIISVILLVATIGAVVLTKSMEPLPPAVPAAPEKPVSAGKED